MCAIVSSALIRRFFSCQGDGLSGKGHATFSHRSDALIVSQRKATGPINVPGLSVRILKERIDCAGSRSVIENMTDVNRFELRRIHL